MDNSTMKNTILFGSFSDVRERTNTHEKIAELFIIKWIAVVCASRKEWSADGGRSNQIEARVTRGVEALYLIRKTPR